LFNLSTSYVKKYLEGLSFDIADITPITTKRMKGLRLANRFNSALLYSKNQINF